MKQVGKHPIVCRDTPGFVVNRILLPIMGDVVNLWDQGLASAQDIDDACRMGMNWPIGPRVPSGLGTLVRTRRVISIVTSG